MTTMDEFRPVDIGGRVRSVRTEEAERPLLAWVPIRRIVIDTSYQRDILARGWKSIERIARHFDWARFTPCLVSPLPDGRYALIDGQHRTHGALLAGHDEIPALIVPMSRKEAARAFSWVNSAVTKITTFQVYKAALAAGEDWANGAHAAVTDAGCRLMPYNRSASAKRPGEVYAIGLIRSYVDDGIGEVVTRGLSAIRGNEAGDHVQTYNATILKPWFGVLAESQLNLRCDLDAFLDHFDLLEAWDRATDEARRTRRESGPSILRGIIAEELRSWRQSEEAAA